MNPSHALPATGGVRIVKWSPDQAAERLPDMAQVYRSAFVRPMASREYFISIVSQGLQEPGATVIAALDPDEELIGFLYGMSFVRARGWQRAVAPSLEAAGLPQWTQDTFELAEIEVRPQWQGAGVGTAMMRSLLNTCPHPRVVLATEATTENLPVVGWYQGFGFVDLLPGFRYPHGRAAVIMGRESTDSA